MVTTRYKASQRGPGDSSLWVVQDGGSFSRRAPRHRRDMRALDVPQMLEMTESGLDALFQNSPAGPIPRGEARGTVLVQSGTELSGPAAKLVHLLVWQGKVFDPERGELRNEILPFGIKAVRAAVYKDPSWLDRKETIVLDYSKTSLIAHWIRDEIREVAPGIYLGLVYWEHDRVLHFALEFPA